MRPILGHTYQTEICRVTIETMAEADAHMRHPACQSRRSGFRGKCKHGHSYGYDSDGKVKGCRMAAGYREVCANGDMDLIKDVTSVPVLVSLGAAEALKMRLRTGYRYAFRSAEGHVDITGIKTENGQTVATGNRHCKLMFGTGDTWEDGIGHYDSFGKSLNGNPGDAYWAWDLVRELGPTPKTAARAYQQAAEELVRTAAAPALKLEIGKRYVTEDGFVVGPLEIYDLGSSYFTSSQRHGEHLFNAQGYRYDNHKAPGNIIREYVAPVKVEAGKRYAFRGAPGSVTISGNSQKWPDKWNGKPDAMTPAGFKYDLSQHSWNSEGRRHADRESDFDLVKELPAVRPMDLRWYPNPLRSFYGRSPSMMIVDEAKTLNKWLNDFIYGGSLGGKMSATTRTQTRLEKFDAEAGAKVNADRGKIYGHPKVDFDRAARLKAVVAECKDPLVRHVLEMIAVKMARLIETPDHLDSYVDIAGYARTGVMVTDPDPLTAGKAAGALVDAFRAQKKAAE